MAKSKAEYWLTEDGLLLLSAWARDGLTDEQIASNMGVSTSTLYNYKNAHLPILESLKKGKEVIDIEVENALNKKALGFKEIVRKPIKCKTVIYQNGKREKESEEIVYADEEIYIPPDVTAQIYWLNNRKPDQWRNKPMNEVDSTTLERVLDVLDAVKEQAKNG